MTKIYTQAYVDTIERSADGRKYLPRGEYAGGIHFESTCVFPGECVLGDGCTLGDGCRLGDGCKLENGIVDLARYIKIGPIGSRNDSAYFYLDVSGEIFVRAGCWFGEIGDFADRVKQVHAGTRHERDYMAALEFAKAVLRKGE